MKKIIFKTIITTVCVIVLLGVAAFGIASLVAPRAMMDFTADIGLEEMSGDFAYREYERTGDVDCLARSFLIAAEKGRDKKADERFEKLYAHEGFDGHCKAQDEIVRASAENETEKETFARISYRSYVCGIAAAVRYRLGADADEIVAFAVKETDAQYPELCAALRLAEEAKQANDRDMIGKLLISLEESGMKGSSVYTDIEKLMEEEHA